MSINANYLVNISPRVISSGATDLETIGNVLTKSTRLPSTQIAREFASATAVADYFGADSDEYKFAAQYFAGYNNQMKGITALVISRRVETASAAWIRGAEFKGTLATLKAITAGAMKIMVGGSEKAVTAVDLSEATSLSDCAQTIATAIGGVSGVFDSVSGAFVFTTTATGANASIGFATAPESGTDISTILGLTEAAGATLSQGMDAMTITDNLNAIAEVTRNWVGLCAIYELTNAENLEVAAWCDIDDDYCFFPWSSADNVKNQTAWASTAFNGLDAYNCVGDIFGDQQDAAFAMACGAAIDWERTQGMITWFGKTTSGLNPRVLSDTDAAYLDSKHVNYIGQFAARNSTFRFMNRGILTGGIYGYVDTLYAMIWLKSKLQTSIMNGFTAVSRAPYNERGYAMVGAWLTDPITAAIRCGVIDSGLMLSESQKNQIMNEVGEDISLDLYSKGYWYRIEDPSASVRAERGSPVIYFYICYAGSIQRIAFPLSMAV